MKRKIASKADILGTTFARHEDIEIPEWDLTVRIRSMTAADRDAWGQEMYTESQVGLVQNFRARLLAHVLIDEEGKRIFTPAEAAALGEQDSEVIERIYKAAMKLNKLGKEATEEAEKNLEPGPRDASLIN